MKIGISVLGDLSKDDGTIIRAKNIFDLLNDHHYIKLIVRGNRDDTDDLIVIKPEGSKIWNLKLIPVLFRNDFDLIYCSADYYGFFTYFLLSKFFHYKIIFEAHGIKSIEFKKGHEKSTVNYFKFKISQLIEKFVMKRSDHVIALSKDIHDYYSVFNKSISTIPVFVDEKLFKPVKKVKNKDEKIKTIGLIGPFESYHINVNILKFVYNNLDKFDDRIKFLVIGKCDYIIDNDKLKYTGYVKDTNEYAKIIASLDAVLIPSKFPSFGPLTKILESMACSTPVFVTSSGAKGLEHYKNNEDIFVFEEEEILNGINRYLFSDGLIDVGKESRKLIEKFYSKNALESKLLGILDTLY